MQTANFAVAQGIDHGPAFNWWVKYVLKKRDKIIASTRKCQTKCLKKSHKFVIELTKTVEQDVALYSKNDNMLWADIISKDLENTKMTFEIFPDWKPAPIGHKFVQCHMVFDIKMVDFR